MAYQTGSASTLADLIEKLTTFAGANGWTVDQFDGPNGRWAIHQDDCYVSGRWNVSAPLHMGLYQALGYTIGETPGYHPGDSGNGYNDSKTFDTLLQNERCVSDIGNGPYTSYHFFIEDTGTEFCLHAAVQVSPEVYRHFGFGTIKKLGSWTGGEYCYGQYHTGTSSITTSNTCFFDGLNISSQTNFGRRNATIRLVGFPGQLADSKWGSVGAQTTQYPVNDSDNAQREMLFGGWRGGPIAQYWGSRQGSNDLGFIPTYPIWAWHRERNTARVRFLGYLLGVRGVHLRNFPAEQEVTIGGDVWIVFPAARRTSEAITNRTYYQGVMYRRVD